MFGMSNDKDGIVKTKSGATVVDLFPEFKPGEVLRFTRLFGPAKSACTSQIWRNARRSKKRRRQEVMDEGFPHRTYCSRSLRPNLSNCLADDDEVKPKLNA